MATGNLLFWTWTTLLTLLMIRTDKTLDSSEINALHSELELLRQENTEFRKQLGMTVAEQTPVYDTKAPELPLLAESLPAVTNISSIEEKIRLFRSLFRGREDVYAAYWQNDRTGKKGYSPACEDPWSLRKGQPRKYLPLTDQVINDHLSGNKTVGAFPLLKDNTCWFLACDFDKEGWKLDAVAYLDTCKRHGIPAYLERSRSGNGGHVWIFFSSPGSAVSARQLGMRILRETMDVRGDLDLGSYDRFFPNQDFVPRGGFGNLIAMPLQKKCRAIGNTEFLDVSTTELRTYPDQWAFLSNIQRLTSQQLDTLLEVIPPVTLGPGNVESASEAIRARYPAPKQIRCEFWSSFSIEKSGIPPWMLSKLKHLASLHNPEFYKMQKLRKSTYKIPRFIKGYREDFSHFHLPRGTCENVNEIARQAGSELICVDRRQLPEPLSFQFHGSLSPEQEKAIKIVLRKEMGLFVAPPGAGKTVMGCFAIAKRNLPTLILAHRKPILEQWRKQLTALLGLQPSQIGQIGGGKKEQNRNIDLAMLQTLARLEDLSALFSKYGFIIVDECHHLPAATFEACIREAPARYILGLTATPYRRDGLQDILIMQCGPVRHKMSEQTNNLPLQLNIRETEFACPADEDTPIQEIFRQIVHDDTRNALIERDISEALKQGRRCLVLSHWNEHCQSIADKLAQKGKKTFVLSGTQGKKERAAILKSIQDTPQDKDLTVVATGQYLGEGFDCPQLDTLFLAFPVSFKGKLIQYVGRIMREHPSKNHALVYDYLDSQVPVLNRMHVRRLKTYKTLGFNHNPAEGILL